MWKIALILDLDNTLYSWMDSYTPALDATIQCLKKEIGLSEEKIRESFKRVFQRHQSVEVVGMVRELDIWSLDPLAGEQTVAQEIAQDRFWREFGAHLRLYPHVLDILEWAKQEGHLLIAFSDARAHWVHFRLKTLGIEGYFDRIYTLEDEAENSTAGSYPSVFVQYPQEQCKPSTAILKIILHDYNLSTQDVYVVGDNKRKDIAPAADVGIHNIWAKYGKAGLPANRRLMSLVTPWTAAQRAGSDGIEPQHTINDFSEILSIVERGRVGDV